MTDPTHAAAEGGDEAYRLPRNVSPRRYELVITPDLDRGTFSGEEVVDLEVHEPTDAIALNAVELEVSEARLEPAGTGAAVTGTVTIDPEEERLVITHPEPVTPGRWRLHLSFAGRLNEKLAGFYPSTYTDAGGQAHTLGVTQFEAVDARRAFPCWDEPDRKAVFSVTIRVPRGLTAVANTQVASDEDEEGWPGRRVRFADTMPLSTYLVAWVVGRLEATPPVDVEGVPLRVVHVPGKEHLTAFALEVGAHALRYFAEWFGIPYPGDKLDLIALPDFAAGAMENVGAVTFRESLLLVDPASASRLELQDVADVICHEIAHMWFGDLVTMRWWNGIWLNEAFATFMETHAVDAFRPEWQRWVSFGRSRAAAFTIDGLSVTRPIEYPVHRPEDAEGMFDILTYLKGASVLRMLEAYLGPEVFRAGIRRYLDEHRHGNAETTDLWDALEAASGEPVRTTMDSWIFQGGYPLVTVTGPAEGAGGTVSLSQRPFRYRRHGDPGLIGRDWWVPVVIRTEAEGGGRPSEHRVLLPPEGATLELPAPPRWVLANAGGYGFYRAAYGDDLQARLTDQLDRLEPLERFNLVSDTWAGVLAGVTPLADFASLARVLASAETDPDVWAILLGPMDLLDRVVPGDDRPALQAFVRSIASGPFGAVGWQPVPGEDERRGTLRATLLRALGVTGADPDVRARASRLHAEALDGRAPIPPDLAQAVVTTVAKSGGAAEWETFVDRYRHPATPQEELRYLHGLTAFDDVGLARRTLELSLDEVRTQDAPYLLAGMLSNDAVGPVAWAFVTRHWDEILSRFPDNSIPRMLNVSLLMQPGLPEQVHAFLASHPLRSGQRLVVQTLERLDVHVAFGRAEGAGIAGALARA